MRATAALTMSGGDQFPRFAARKRRFAPVMIQLRGGRHPASVAGIKEMRA
jgi:hypothetical protein